MYQPRYFVGCSVHEGNSEDPQDEIYLHANLPYSDSTKREEIGKSLAKLVLEKHPFSDGDIIMNLRKDKLVSRSAGIGDIRVPYTTHRYNPKSHAFEKGFSEQMQQKVL